MADDPRASRGQMPSMRRVVVRMSVEQYITVDRRFPSARHQDGDLAWIILYGGTIIDVFDYEASGYPAARDKHGNVKVFRTPWNTLPDVKAWARKHPERWLA